MIMQNEMRMVNKYEFFGINSGMYRMIGVLEDDWCKFE